MRTQATGPTPHRMEFVSRYLLRYCVTARYFFLPPLHYWRWERSRAGLTNLVLTAPLFPPVFRTLEAPFWRLEGGWSAAETVTPLGLEAVRRILSNTSSVSISVSVLQLGEGGWELLSIRGACVGVACDE